LVYGVPDLVGGVRDFARRTGVEPIPGGRHVGLGTANYLVGLGEWAYLEIIGPDPDAAPGDGPRELMFGIENLTEPRLLTWAIATTDIDAAIRQARGCGYDPGDATRMSRRTAQGRQLEWRLTPDSIDRHAGLLPFLIDWGQSTHPTSAQLPELSLVTVTIQSPRPDETRAGLAALGTEVLVSEAPSARINAVLTGPRGDHPLVG
jgi:Glyoxalase-like domain